MNSKVVKATVAGAGALALALDTAHAGDARSGEVTGFVVILVFAGYAMWQLVGAVMDRRRVGTPPASESEAVGRLHLDLDRTLVMATLDTALVARQSDLTPGQAARHWGAILIGEDERTFRLLIAPPPDGAVAAVELLRMFYPHHVAVWEAPTVLTGQPASPELRALVAARLGGSRHSGLGPTAPPGEFRTGTSGRSRGLVPIPS